MRIADIRHSGGGWEIVIEIPNAYTDGSSRFETIPVPPAMVPDSPTKLTLLAAVRKLIAQRDALRSLLIGEEL